MKKTAEFPTWRISNNAENNFIWEPFVRDGPYIRRRDLAGSSCLPSMSELFADASQKREMDDRMDEGVPIFKTSSRSSASVKQSSLQKSEVVFQDFDRPRAFHELEGDSGVPLFKTASGRFINARQSSLVTAEMALRAFDQPGVSPVVEASDGMEDGLPMFKTASGKSVPVRESSLRKAEVVLSDFDRPGASPIPGGDEIEEGVPMLKMASGRSVSVRQSSLVKAAAVLRDFDQPGGHAALSMSNLQETDRLIFDTGGGKLAEVSGSLLENVESLHNQHIPRPEEMPHNDLNVPMLQTGLGRPVSLTTSSVKKALSILQEKDKREMDLFGIPAIDIPGIEASVPVFQSGSGKPMYLKQSSIKKALSIFEELDEVKMAKLPQREVNIPVFQTGSGRPVSLKQSSIRKALSIFHEKNEVEMENMPENEFSIPLFQTGLGRPVSLKQSSVEKALSILQDKERVEISNMHHSELISPMLQTAPMSHQIEFQTAGGRSLPISDDAIRRAKILLGDDETDTLQNVNPATSSDLAQQKPSCRGHTGSKRTFTHEKENKFGNTMLNIQNRAQKNLSGTHEIGTLTRGRERTDLRPPLANITNRGSATIPNHVLSSGEKRGQRQASSISPFKRPRSSRFTTPMRKDLSLLDSGQSRSSSTELGCPVSSLSTHFPPRQSRKGIKDFLGRPPNLQKSSLINEIKDINPEKAATYKFKTSPGSEDIGPDEFHDLLIQAGASSLNATKDWVRNHFKWIVWKLACLERGYPELAKGKYLTAANVFEELKYRYDREVKHGHRSAIKRILDGDSSPSSILVLCVSAIHPVTSSNANETSRKAGVHDVEMGNTKTSDISVAQKVELTDGWYSINANLDTTLSNHVVSGKIFVGQKLRLWGSSLLGWAAPVSCLEACKSVSLQLHINGTYRAHWAERLGFCKGFRFPLAFRSIKPAGGQVPKTLVGVSVIYPILYKERLPDGSSIVRSERMENKVLYYQNQRRLLVAEEIMSKQEKFLEESEEDSEEGATIFKLLETSAEPDVLMAGMSSQQLISVSNYQAKKEAKNQNAIVKKIEKALEEEGLGSRDVSPFMRVRVVGLTPRGSSKKSSAPVQGLVVIWNPTKQQMSNIEEGRMYAVSGLNPLSANQGMIHLQARGSTSSWTLLPPSASELFEPFFNPRHPVQLYSLGELPLSSEFDTAVTIVHVGEVFSSGHLKKQWIFVADGSQEEHHFCLLAISLCLPVLDPDHSFSPALTGCQVCFCNLIKRARDEPNRLWVADATENSIWSQPAATHYSLLKEAAGRVEKWARASPLAIGQLRERVLCIVDGGCNG